MLKYRNFKVSRDYVICGQAQAACAAVKNNELMAELKLEAKERMSKASRSREGVAKMPPLEDNEKKRTREVTFSRPATKTIINTYTYFMYGKIQTLFEIYV